MLALFLSLALVAEAVTADSSPRHPLLEFTLNETDQQLLKQFDRPPQIARGNGYFVMQFHALVPRVVEADLPLEWLANSNGSACDGKYSYTAYIGSDGLIQSMLHQPDRKLPIQYLFPAGSYTDFEVINSAKIAFSYRVRKLSGDRFLITALYQPRIKFIDQVVLVKSSAVATAFPLLASKLP